MAMQIGLCAASLEHSGQRNLLLYFQKVDHTEVPLDLPLAEKDDKISVKASRSFFDLPLELREEVYRHLLQNLCHELSHPWDSLIDYEEFSAFVTYVNLRLTSRLVNDELRRVFEKEFRARVTYCVDDVYTLRSLQALQKNSTQYPLLHPDVRFLFRANASPRRVVKKRKPEKKFKDDLTTFFRDFLEEWDALPREHSVNGLRFAETTEPTYNPFEHGFEVRLHHQCGKTHAMCNGYREIIYPPLEHSLRLRTYTWRVEVANTAGPGDTTMMKSGCLMIEGKLSDPDLDVYRQKLCDRLEASRLPSEDEGLEYDSTEEAEIVW